MHINTPHPNSGGRRRNQSNNLFLVCRARWQNARGRPLLQRLQGDNCATPKETVSFDLCGVKGCRRETMIGGRTAGFAKPACSSILVRALELCLKNQKAFRVGSMDSIKSRKVSGFPFTTSPERLSGI